MRARRRAHYGRCTAVATSLLLSAGSLPGALAQGEVPFVPTPMETVQAMLDIAEVGPEDFVIDLGSGDGRIVIAAAKRGARALGVDLDAELLETSRENARRAGVAGRVQLQEQDLFETDLSRASVLTMYLLPRVNLHLRDRILREMKPGARVVSHDFDMGEWPPDDVAEVGADTVYLWIVPARVEGSWSLRHPGGGMLELELTQRFQQVSGMATAGGRSTQIISAVLVGDRIQLEFPDPMAPERTLVFDGRVDGSRMDGSLSTGERVALSRAA